jgi:hypothetical protein
VGRKDRSAGPEESATWFVQDVPIDSAETDAFSHVDIADNLRTMILTVTCGLTIGLTGSFGVGKSTVIGLLAGMFKGSKSHVVVRLSAERHTAAALQRSLIYAFAEALVRQADVAPAKVADILQGLEATSAHTEVLPTDTPAYRWWQRASTARRTALLTGAGALVAVLVFYSVIASALGDFFRYLLPTGLPFALSFGVLATVVAFGYRAFGGDSWLSSWGRPATLTTTRPRPEAADEFERVFAELAHLVDKRLVVAVDDIDRLEPTLVLDALNTIRSFQQSCTAGQQPVFIISCDVVIVRDAIVTAEPGLSAGSDGRVSAADAFLDRLFTQRQAMPPHPRTDMLGYARQVLTRQPHSGAAKLGDDLEDVLAILIHDAVTDPRHVIRLLNTFFGDYRLAIKREDSTGGQGIKPGEITKNPTVLARLTVLAVDFPDFYHALRDNEVLLALMTKRVRGGLDGSESEVLRPYLPANAFGVETGDYSERPLRRPSALERFIGRTSSVRAVPSLQPFLYRGQDELTRALGTHSARAVKDALVNQQTSALQDRVDVLVAASAHVGEDSSDVAAGRQGAENQLAAVIGTVAVVLDQVERLELANALVTASSLASALNGELLARLAEIVASALVRSPTAVLEPLDVVMLAVAAMKPTTAVQLIDYLLLGEEPEANAWQERDLAVLSYRTEIEQRVGVPRVREYLELAAARLEAGNLRDVREWLAVMLAKQRSHDPFSERVMRAVLQVVSVSSEDIEKDLADAVLALLKITDVRDADSIAAQSTELVGVASKPQAVRLGVLVMSELADPPVDRTAVLLAETAEGMRDDAGAIGAEFDDEMLIALMRLCDDCITRSGAQKWKELGTFAPVLAAIVADTAGDEDAGELIAQVLTTFELAMDNELSIVHHLAVAMVTAWETSRGNDFPSLTYAKTLLARLDSLPDAARGSVSATITAALRARPETDREFRATLLLLPALSDTTAGRAAIGVLVDQLNQQLAPTQLDHVTAAVTVLRAVYRELPGAFPQDNTIAALGNLLQQGGSCTEVAFTGLTSIPWTSSALRQVVAHLDSFVAQMAVHYRVALLRQLAERPVDEQFALNLPDRVADALIEVSAGTGDPQVFALFAASSPDRRNTLATHVPGSAQAVRGLLDRTPETDRDELIATFVSECALALRDDEGGAVKETCAATLGTCADADAEAYASAVSRLLREQINGEVELGSDVWAALMVSLAEASWPRFVEDVVSAVDGDQTELTRVLPALVALTLRPAVAAPLPAERLAQTLARWTKGEGDEDVARALAQVLAVVPTLRSAAKMAIGSSPRRSASNYSAWRAASDALKTTTRN